MKSRQPKCPECGKKKFVIRSIEAGKRICLKCKLKFSLKCAKCWE